MRKFDSEAFEAIYEDVLYDFKAGRITEAELREFEEDAFIEVANESDIVNEVDDANKAAGELISLSQSINKK